MAEKASIKTPESSPESRRRSFSKWLFTGRRRAYNLVVLAVSVTLLNIWVASVTPLWSHQIKRDKEAELIFRGLQYAEAIRLFQLRNNRLPTRLEELIEVEPRSIRQLWENPMREDGRWGLIPQGVNIGVGQPVQNADPNAPPGQSGQPDSGLGSDPFATGDDEDGKDGAPPGVLLSRDPDDDFAPPSSVPIRGVYHPAGEDSVLSFMGKSNHRDWQFTADIFATMKQGAPANPALVTPFLAQEIGKPWPPGVVPQVPQPSSQPPRPTSTPGDGHMVPNRQQGQNPGAPGAAPPQPGTTPPNQGNSPRP